MIIPDINLLIYTYNSDAQEHSEARTWWEKCLSSRETVGLPWVVVLGFLRIITSSRVFENPMSTRQAVQTVRSWMSRPNVQLLQAGSRHGDIFFGYLEELGTAGNLTTDAHLAALAQEYQAVLHTTDLDFQRFAGIRWINPIN